MRDPALTGPPADDQRLGPLFVGIVVVEALCILSLYWFSRHFA